MARFRWLSTFTLLGMLLIVLGIVGKVFGPKFIYDPGQIPDGNEAWAYIAVGLLMLLNGWLSPLPPDSEIVHPARPASGKGLTASSAPSAHLSDSASD